MIQRVEEILATGRPQDVLGAADLLARLMGLYAPPPRVPALRPPEGGSASYKALVETLQEWREHFP